MKPFPTFLLIVLSSACAGAQSSDEESGNVDKAKQRAAESLQLALEEVKRFEFTFARDGEDKLKLHPTPLYRHANPHRGEVYTNIFLWTKQGRPEAIASISNWYRPRRYHGLAVTSLATKRLIGMRDGKEIWRPNKPGIELRPIPDASAPGETALRRLREMRNLAREFRAEFKRDSKYPEGGALRLLSKPIHRYENQETNVIDGALFGFAAGASPQLILVIEARQSKSGPRWEYDLAPRNSTEYHVWHKDRKVWSLPQLAPPWPNSRIPTNTYTVFPDLQREGRTQQFVEQLLKINNVPEKTDGS